MPGVVRLGDRSDHNGMMKTASSNYKVNGRYVCRVGDIHRCPDHGDTPIVSTPNSKEFNGAKIATVGAIAACGAILIEGSEDVIAGSGGAGGGGGSTAPPNESPPPGTDTTTGRPPGYYYFDVRVITPEFARTKINGMLGGVPIETGTKYTTYNIQPIIENGSAPSLWKLSAGAVGTRKVEKIFYQNQYMLPYWRTHATTGAKMFLGWGFAVEYRVSVGAGGFIYTGEVQNDGSVNWVPRKGPAHGWYLLETGFTAPIVHDITGFTNMSGFVFTQDPNSPPFY
jgi:uncharacterized Zn-binding protein involved in type VI secretion